MDDLILTLIVLVVLILISSGIFWLVRRKQAENEQVIARMAAGQGWTVESIREPLAWGLRLKSEKWTLEALSRSSGREAGPGSSNVAMSTIWWADYPGSTLLIGPRTSQVNIGGLGDTLTRKVLQMALGAHANGLVEVQVGSETFRRNFIVWAQEPAEAERLVSPSLESILRTWKGVAPFIKRTTEGLNIELRSVHLKKTDEIRALINLGELLLADDD